MVYSSSSIGMDTQTFSVNVATMLTMKTSTMTKQAFALEDPKHCNTDGWPSCYNVGYNYSRQSWGDELMIEQ